MTEVGLAAVVAVLAVVQSLFGVGLLVLGTPILLLAGLRFENALWLLLPASVTVSSLQLIVDRGVSRADVGLMMKTGAPAVISGLLLVLSMQVAISIDLPVAVMLLASVLIRLSPDVFARIRDVCRAHQGLCLALIGFVHGFTNMGGSLLPAYAASRHYEKMAIRQTIALAYVVFAGTQLAGLAVAGQSAPGLLSFWLMVVAGGAYATVGRATLASIGPVPYARIFNAFMVVIATVLLWRTFVRQ